MDFISQMEPWYGSEEKNALAEYMDEGGWLTEFKKTSEFEMRIAEYTGSKHCIVVNNGTISLTLAALACGIEAGDEIIVPNYTMIASPNSVSMIGACPIFVDVEPETLCLDLDKIKKSLTKKTKAIMFVSANGRYPQAGIDEFVKFAKANNLILIEDSAQSLGSFYPDKSHIGTKGIVGSFSFSTPKIITTGQGGALITDDDTIAGKLRKLKDFGRSGGGNDVHDSIGYNFKFTELQAVIGIEQMKKLPWRVQRKKEMLELYQKELSGVTQVSFFHQDLINTTPWFIDILVEKRADLQVFLKQNNIGSRIMYPPINKQEAYKVPGEHPVSNMIGEKGIWLPSASQLTNEQIKYICGKVREFYSK